MKVTAAGLSADLISIEWENLAAESTTTVQISVINNGTIPTTLSNVNR